MDRPLLRRTLSVLATLAFVGGMSLVSVAVWLRPLAEARRALEEGRLEGALERFAAAERRFDRLPASKVALRSLYETTRTAQLALRYRLGEYDALLETAASSPPTAATHFWSGCALFQKARQETDPEARLGWLGRADEAFRRALELDPAHWDTKFNYELTRRLLAALQKDPTAPPTQLMQLLRPQPRASRPQGRRTG